MKRVSMCPPKRQGVEEILAHGELKHGWLWLKDEDGYWWGARSDTEHILQVRPEPPDFPCRRWNASSRSPTYHPLPKWVPLSVRI